MLQAILKPIIGIFVLLLIIPSMGFAQRFNQNKLEISADFPGGNILVQRISNDTVYLHQNLHDTEGNWFYWSFRIRGAANRKLHFKFVHPWKSLSPIQVIASHGPAVSHDEGKTWKWLAKPASFTKYSFDYAFSKTENEVYFSMGMNYTEAHLQRFLKQYDTHPHLEIATLAQSKEGRSIERLHLGNLRGKPKYRMLLTARHHACEMMASYVLEGIIEGILSNSEEGEWLKEHVEFLVVPFMDKDGVENGDQGKNRRGRDHNRDYSGESIYASTQALRAFVPVWTNETPFLGLDLHCPYIAGGVTNERIYLVGGRDLMIANAENKLANCIAKRTDNATGLRYDVSDNVAFGTSWNTGKNYQKGASFREWAGTLPTVHLASTFEIPYAIASEREVNQATAKEFGKYIALGLYDYLSQLK